jgi:hypothetical protein
MYRALRGRPSNRRFQRMITEEKAGMVGACR